MGNALDLESLTKEFQFVELGRQVSEFVSQHPHVEVVRLKSEIADLRRRLAGQDRELCQLAEANAAEQNSQLEGQRGAIDEVAKKQQHEREKVSGLQEATGEVRRQMNQTEEAVEQRVGPLEPTTLGLAEVKDRTSRVESDVAGLRVTMADNSAKVEEVQREVAGLKAQLSDCCPKVNQDLTNLARELATLREEIRELQLQKAAMADQRRRHEREIRDMKHEIELLRKGRDGQRESQEGERRAVADVRKVVG
jgi:chromosome segregation ATPase